MSAKWSGRREAGIGTLYFEGLTVGDVELGPPLVVDRDEMLAYAQAFDPWPFHVDEPAAAAPFGGLIASGGYAFGLLFRSIHAMYNRPDRTCAFLGALEWKVRFANPVGPGDRLRDKVTILQTHVPKSPRRVVVVSHKHRVDGEPPCRVTSAALLSPRDEVRAWSTSANVNGCGGPKQSGLAAGSPGCDSAAEISVVLAVVLAAMAGSSEVFPGR